MSAFDEIISGAKKYLDSASIKTNEFIEASRAQIEKSQLSGLLREEYTKLGKLFFDMSEKDIDNSGRIKLVLSKIHDLLEDIELARESLFSNTASKEKTCKNCGATNSSKFEYCSKCGTKFD